MSNGYKVFCGNSHLQLARDIAAQLGCRLFEPDLFDDKGRQITWLSNGNVFVDLKESVRGYDCVVIQSQAEGNFPLIGKDAAGQDIFDKKRRLSVSDHCLELFWLIRGFKEAAAASVTVVWPYMPYVRSDKKDHHRTTVGAKLFLDLMTEAGADRLILLDPHFAQIHGFSQIPIDAMNTKPIFSAHLLKNYDLSNAVMVAPDLGESRHIGPIASILGLPIAVIDKRREKDNEKAEAITMIGNVEGKDCWIFDDETASCGTLLEAANFCAKFKARSVRACITHPVLSVVEGLAQVESHELIKSLDVLDTIPVPPEKRVTKLKVISSARFFAEAIRRVLSNVDSMDDYKRDLYRQVEELKSLKRLGG